MSERASGRHTAIADVPTEIGEAGISAREAEVVQVTRMVGQLPDVRRDRVEALKAQIEAGTYHVSGEDIADLNHPSNSSDNTNL